MGYGNWGISCAGVVMYKELQARFKGEGRDEKRGIKKAWDEYAEFKGLDVDWKDLKKRKVSTETNDVVHHNRGCQQYVYFL